MALPIKQNNIPVLGALVDAFVTSLPLLSLINFISMSAILWTTTIQPYTYMHFSWVTIWMFLGVMALMVIVAMVITYKYIIPSVWRFRYKQMKGDDANGR